MAQIEIVQSKKTKKKFLPEHILEFEFGSVPLIMRIYKWKEEIFMHIFNIDNKMDSVTLSVAEYLTWANQESIVENSTLSLDGKSSHGLQLDLFKLLALINIKSEILDLVEIMNGEDQSTSINTDLKTKIFYEVGVTKSRSKEKVQTN